MRAFELGTVFRKELRGLLRDRHILIYSVAVPAFLYPAVLLGIVQILGYVRGVEERQTSRVELQDRATDGLLRDALRAAERRIELVDSSETPIEREAAEKRLRSNDPGERLDGVVVARSAREGAGSSGNASTGGPDPVLVEVYFSEARESSRRALARVGEAVQQLRDDLLTAEADRVGVPHETLDPLEIEEISLSTAEEVANHVAALILPLLMMLMLALGAFYPALDAAVGEKERGTIETTLVTPASRAAIVGGKYLAVTSVSLVSFALHLGGMWLTFAHFQAQLGTRGFTLTWTALIAIVVTAILLALLFSAVMMLLAFLARSFKEGQAYVTPIYLVSLLPIVVTTNPDITLSPALAAIPLVGSALLFRDALEDRLDLGCAAIVIASSAALAGLALFAAVRVLSRESVATGGHVPPPRWLALLFGRERRADRSAALRGEVPTEERSD